ncbi:MAG: hypothetical protein NTW59_01205, partial [Candidatus Diapherotrites archaeon]|nr:hypothetical protein [Candidatus Diapherotrites archaeon]
RMTEAMPPTVARNFIYKKLWVDTHKKKKNATLLFLGDVGTGKSIGALRFAEELDPNFSVERVCFSIKDLLRLLDEGDSKGKLGKGSVVILDEIAGSEENADSRSFMSRENKIISYVQTIFRARQLIVIFIAPFFGQVDKRLRQIGVSGIAVFKGVNFKKKCSKAAFYWSVPAPLIGKTYLPKPRLVDKKTGESIIIDRILVDKPSEALIKDYEVKKSAFIKDNIHEWYGQLVAIDNARQPVNKADFLKTTSEKIKANAEAYKVKDKFSPSLILMKEGISQRAASAIAATLNKEQDG